MFNLKYPMTCHFVPNSKVALILCFLTYSLSNALVTYDSDSGRRFFIWSLCIGATNPEKCVETEFYGQNIIASFEADCSDLIFKGPCRVVIDVDDGYTLLGITFKSETNIETITNNANDVYGSQKMTTFSTDKNVVYGKVMNDLLVGFGRLWNNGMGAFMNQLWTEYCDLYISFSGFSLGGCLAQLAAVRFKEEQWWPADQMFYYGFGVPRCGNEDFAYHMDQSVADKYNIIWMNDPIPSYPKTTCTGVGEAQLNSCVDSYFHCCTKILYTSYSSPAINTYSSCTPNNCVPAVTQNSDHWTYFETSSEDVDSLTCTDSKKFP